jgi:predicted RNase H-like HicB family nuclease
MNDFILDLNIEPLDEGGFLATSTDLPGLLAEGRTQSETIEIAQDVARKLIDSYIEHGDPLPEKIAKQLGIKRKINKFRVPVAVAL